MRVIDAIREADAYRPNSVDSGLKVLWLKRFEAEIKQWMSEGKEPKHRHHHRHADKTIYVSAFGLPQIFYNYDGANGAYAVVVGSEGDFTAVCCFDEHEPHFPPLPPVPQEFNDETELIFKDADEGVYTLYLASKIDEQNMDTTLYANDAAAFNSAYAEAKARYRRANRYYGADIKAF